jgi:hypothetical protein
MSYSVMQLDIVGIGVVWRKSVGRDGAGMGTDSARTGWGRKKSVPVQSPAQTKRQRYWSMVLFNVTYVAVADQSSFSSRMSVMQLPSECIVLQ